MKKDDAQPENMLLFAMTFPKRSFLRTVAYVVHYELSYLLPQVFARLLFRLQSNRPGRHDVLNDNLAVLHHNPIDDYL